MDRGASIWMIGICDFEFFAPEICFDFVSDASVHSLRVLQLPILATSLGRRAGFGHFCRASWAGHSCKLPIKYNRGRSDRGLFYSMSVITTKVLHPKNCQKLKN